MVQQANKPRQNGDSAEYGRVVRRIREERNLTQTQLGKRMGNYSTSVISRIEKGSRALRAGELELVASALDVSVEQITTWATQSNETPAGGLVPRQRRPGPLRTEPSRKPRQLPMAPAEFVGRDEELAELGRWYRDTRPGRRAQGGVRVVVITGMAGVGKSTLALRWAHQIADDFPDGNLHFGLRGFDVSAPPAEPSDALAAFLQGLGRTNEPVSSEPVARSALFRSEVSNRRLLIILDNAVSGEQVRPLLPGSPGCLVIVTSRNSLGDLVVQEGAHPFRLDRFTPEDARRLLALRAGEDQVAGEPQATRDLIEVCARLPLAVAAIGSRVRLRPPRSLRSLAIEISEEESRLNALGSLGGEQTVRGVLECSYNRLSVENQQLFRLLAVHPGPDFTVEAAASLAAIPRKVAQKGLDQLVSANVVQESAPRRFRFHDLFHELAVELLRGQEPAGLHTAALRRMLDHYMRSAYNAAELLPVAAGKQPTTSPEPDVQPEFFAHRTKAKNWFENEHSVLLNLLQFAEREEYFSACWTIARYFDPHLDLKGYFFDLESVWRTALRTATRAGDIEAQAMSRHRLGHALACLGNIDEGLEEMQRAVDIRHSLGDLAGVAIINISMADILDRNGAVDAALSYARRANDVAEQDRATALTAWTRNACAMLLARTGHTTEALELVASALEIRRQLNDRFGAAVASDTQAYALAAEGRYDEAIDLYTTAIEIFEDFEAVQHEAQSTERLAQAYRARGDVSAARNMALMAIELYERLETEDYHRTESLRQFLDELSDEG